MRNAIIGTAAAIALLSLAACDPYDPGQRALGGAAIGAGTGAVIGGATGAVGAIGGAATTPSR